MLHGRNPANPSGRRRRTSALAFSLTLMLTLAVLVPAVHAEALGRDWPGPPAAASDWPQGMRGNHHQGFNKAETTLTRKTVGGLTVAWTKPLDGTDSPSVVGDAVFFGGAGVSARRVDIGALLWQADIGGEVELTPAYGHGIIVAAVDGRPGTVAGVDASTGAVLWTRAMHGEISSSPSISGATVYIGYARTVGYGIAALKLGSGGVRWRWTTPDSTFGLVSSPTTDGTQVYFSLDGGTRVVSLDTATGSVRWDETLDSTLGGWTLDGLMVSLRGDRLFAGNITGKLYALDTATGAVIWQKAMARDGVWRPIATTSRALFIMIRDEKLVAVSTADGSTLWTFGTNADYLSPGASVANGVVYLGSYIGGRGNLLALNARTGTRRARVDLGSSQYGPVIPTVSNGKVFLSEWDTALMLSLSASGASAPAEASESGRQGPAAGPVRPVVRR
jgi:eukaryotic-like serine/threonine-protein kinase